MIDYLLIGHITADIVRGERVLGGSVSYAAPVAAAFGHRVGVLTSARPDEPLLRPLRRYADVLVRLADVTTTYENHYRGSKRTQYLYHAAAPLSADHLPLGWLGAPLVHLAPLASELDPAIVEHFPQAKILLTPQGFLRRWDVDGRVSFRYWLDEALLKRVDLLILSKQDIAEQPELEAEYVKHCQAVIVTNGAAGGTLYRHGVAQRYTTPSVRELDPTGAGDIFAASLLASLPRLQGDLPKAAQIAARLAALSVTRQGIETFSAADVQAAFISEAR